MKQEKVSIDSKTHELLKSYCEAKGLKMGAFVSILIKERIASENVQEPNRAQREQEDDH